MSAACDIYVLIHNRREFTEAMLERLGERTNWNRVRKLVLVDDRSTDGADRAAEVFIEGLGRGELRRIKGRTVTKALYRATRPEERDRAPYFVKLDNDFLLAHDWLDEVLGCAERQPEFDVIGFPTPSGDDVAVLADRSHAITRHVVDHLMPGGIFLMRSDAYFDVIGRTGASPFRRNKPYTRNSLSAIFETLGREGRLRVGRVAPALAGVPLDRLVDPSYGAVELFADDLPFTLDEIRELTEHYYRSGTSRKTYQRPSTGAR